MAKIPDHCPKNIRPSRLAGTWYSADPTELHADIESFLKQANESAPVNSTTPLKALIVPHAGYRYSGPTAGYAYQTIANREYERVFILAPSHYVHFWGAALCDYFAFKTPLGEVETDIQVLKDLINCEGFVLKNKAHDPEHAIEIQLPFLQVILKNPCIVPILIAELNPKLTQSIASTLKPYFAPENLFVISSDFTHFGLSFDYFPFSENIAHNIENLDKEAIGIIEKKDPAGFSQFLERTSATICGRNPISILLHCLEKTDDVRLLHYTNSGTLTGDFSSSVSYAALAIAKTP